MDSSVEARPAAQGLFQCTECQRTYTRVDHLARHVRSHLQEKPFQCPTCQKGFGRPDLLKRHAACHETDANGNKRQRRQFNQSSRVSQACKSCASAKLKCDDQKPCARCQQRRIPCEYAGEGHYHSRLSHSAGSQSGNSPQAPRLRVNSLTNTSPIMDPTEQSHAQLPSPSTTVQPANFPPPPSHPQHTELSSGPSLGFQEHYFSDFLRGVMTPIPTETFGSYSPSNWPNTDLGPRNVLDFNVEGNLDFDDADFGLLDQLCGKSYNPDLTQLQSASLQTEPLPTTQEQVGSRKRVGLGAEAFKRSSLARWLPAQQDHAHAELHNLSILRSEGGSPDARLKVDRRCLDEGLDQSSRDKILAMVLNTCEPAKAASVVTAFPPAELLDDLLQNFFAHHRSQTSSYIHIPTFSPNLQKPELLGALVAHGAVLTDIKALHKLGFAIQEAVRTTLPKRCEEANATTRELWLVQAFMCEIEIGLWSGNKRKMEIAESHPQVMVTMLRRAGKFQRSKRASFIPQPQDTGDTLHHKWVEWAKHESFKRLVFHAFLFNGQTSMALLTPPIVSYAELSLSLPDSRELWMAEDAEQWKAFFLKRPFRSPDAQPTLASFLQDPMEFASLHVYHDFHFSSLIILYGLWGMISEFTQLLATLKSRPGHSNAIMALRHQELCQLLHHFRMSLSEWREGQSPETMLVLELLSMYLHMSLEEIQLFAGKEDQDEARRVLPSLQQWIDSSNSRQAIWHAGQVLRAAKSLPPKQLRGFYGIAVYHASLAFWAYGVISQAKARDITGLPNVASGANVYAIWLDGNDASEVQRFIALGRGNPSIGPTMSSDGPAAGLVPLSDPEAVMGVMLDVLKRNFAGLVEGEAMPPLVENLIQLLRDLGKAAGSVGH